ncbi:transposase [Candidatus Accumulibacter vicinus]|uniref:Uncharacterized protein n=1 Tax=Candidatus Accumulibacter vicinus TaxID=2954382 RepID=A0A084XYZ8_9PROT|nr:transposase [Candidatus Accumulibacter vicinus]KFB67692.1 MAG: hypothetical protein CAPSK01_002807 [Candidatus Accumulibacter vicinus]
MSLAANVCLLLSEWIFFLLVAVPPRARRTFVELLISCLLNPEGWVTRAIGAIRREAHWTTYYKLIERASVSVTELSRRLLQLVLRVFPAELLTRILDDTRVPRCAKLGPGISIKHAHSHKANRPTFLDSHQALRHIGFQEIAAIEQNVLRFGLLVEGADNDAFVQREGDKPGEFVALGPTLQSGQACRRAGALGVLDEGVTFGDFRLQLRQLVLSPTRLAHPHSLVAAHDQAFVVVLHFAQRRIEEIRLQHPALAEKRQMNGGKHHSGNRPQPDHAGR